jgi:aspartate/methionine/tyrosine aminotransferase
MFSLSQKLPAHIEFSQKIKTKISHNLSHSCAQALSVKALCKLSGRSLEEATLNYAPLTGSVELKQAIVEFHNHVNKKRYAFDENNALTFCGAQEALAAIYQSVLAPGDEIVVLTPCYPSLVTMAKNMGVTVKSINLTADTHWQLDFDELARNVNFNTRMIVINSPNNPTGSVISNVIADKILAIAKKYQCYLLADDVSQASNFQQLPIEHNYLSYEKSIVVCGMSKSFGLPGIRVGWVVSANKAWLKALLVIKSYGSICCSITDETLALWALQQSNVIINNNNDIIVNNIHYFQKFIDRNHKTFYWHPPQAGIMTVVSSLLAEPINDWALKFTEHTGVLILPCTLFGLSGSNFRLGLGQTSFQKSVDILEEYINT